MKNLLFISYRNVRKHLRQSLFALLALMFGYMSLALFQGYMRDVGRMYEDTSVQRLMWGNLFIEHSDTQERSAITDPFSLALDQEAQKQIQEVLHTEPTVQTASRFLFLSGSISNGSNSLNFMGYGYDLKEGAQIRSKAWAWDALAGVPLDQSTDPEVLIVGQGLGKFLGCKTKQKVKFLNGLDGFRPEIRPFECGTEVFQLSTLTESGQVNSLDLKMAGITDAIYQEIDERFVGLSIEQVQKLLNTDKVHRYSVLLKNGSDIPEVVQRLNQEFQKRNLKVHAIRWQDHREGDLYVRTMDLLTIFRNFVVTIILSIVGISIFNTFVRNITERTREVGTFRSLGFTPKQVLSLILTETLILVFIGNGLGLILSIVMEKAINWIALTYRPGVFSEAVPFRISTSSEILFQSFVFLGMIALFSSFLAVRKIVNKKVSECLIHS
jgi:putative ABC transport system permease protein